MCDEHWFFRPNSLELSRRTKRLNILIFYLLRKLDHWRASKFWREFLVESNCFLHLVEILVLKFIKFTSIWAVKSYDCHLGEIFIKFTSIWAVKSYDCHLGEILVLKFIKCMTSTEISWAVKSYDCVTNTGFFAQIH